MKTGRQEASDFESDPRVRPVGEIIRRWARKSGLLRLTDRQRIWQAWSALLGPDATHTRLVGLKNHMAMFTVDSSALLAELAGFRKTELLEGLQKEVRTYFVRDIRLRLQKAAPRANNSK